MVNSGCPRHRDHMTTSRSRLLNKYINYRPQTKIWDKVMFLHLCVILFTGGGLPNPLNADPLPPVCRPPTHPGYRPSPPRQANKRAVRILLECILVVKYISISCKSTRLQWRIPRRKISRFQKILEIYRVMPSKGWRSLL